MEDWREMCGDEECVLRMSSSFEANTLAILQPPATPSTAGANEDEDLFSFLTSDQNEDYLFLAKE